MIHTVHKEKRISSSRGNYTQQCQLSFPFSNQTQNPPYSTTTDGTLSWSVTIWSEVWESNSSPGALSAHMSFLWALDYQTLRPQNMYKQIKDFLSYSSFENDWSDFFYDTWRIYLGWSVFYYMHPWNSLWGSSGLFSLSHLLERPLANLPSPSFPVEYWRYTCSLH